MSDSFEALVVDMRKIGALQKSMELDAFALDFANRLSALVAELEPYLMPAYGARTSAVADEPGEDEPIYRQMVGSEPAPGSDWVLIDPVNPVEVVASREEYEARRAAGAPTIDEVVTGNGSDQ